MGASTHSRSEEGGTTDALLWVGLLLPPAMWLVQFELVYLLVPWTCASGHTVPIHIAGAVFVLGNGAVAYQSWRHRQKMRLSESGEHRRYDRRRFMATLALWSGMLFTLATLVQATAAYIIDPCAS